MSKITYGQTLYILDYSQILGQTLFLADNSSMQEVGSINNPSATARHKSLT